jgi:hypothetical protein
LALFLVVLSMPTRAAHAQCQDGSAPPCASARRPVERPIDANRVAIVPFRVTTSDTLLGEGFAELLASEFTGQGVPRAVDMGTVIQAWHRAGGGSRNPLTREQSLALARSLGAGVVSEGSIVGLGRSITVTAALLHVPDGKPRGTPARVTTSADSLDYALRRVAAILTATVNSPGTTKISDDARYTNSPEALRAYLEGMAHWRSGRLPEAARSFTAAMARDTLFARAQYRCFIAQAWGVTCRFEWSRLWEVRDRLSDAERLQVTAFTGPNPPREERSLEQRFADVERVVIQLPDNADALFFAGDMWYHTGSVIDPKAQLARAVEYFSRAAAVDSQATYIQHLVEAAIRMRDTALIRRTAAAFMQTQSRRRWTLEWLAAASIGDDATLAKLRAMPPDSGLTSALTLDPLTDAPAKLRDEMYAIWRKATPASQQPSIDQFHGMALALEGRTGAAEATWAAVQADNRNRNLNRFRLSAAMAGLAGFDVARAEQAVREETATDSASLISRKCLLTLSNLRRGVPIPVDTTGFDKWTQHCALAVGILRIPLDSGAVTERALMRADSLVREAAFDTSVPLNGYETRTMAEAWEKFGNPRRALSAIRYRQVGYSSGETPWNFADEGRLAEIVGDIAGAKHAYTMWLQLMRDAEPIYDGKKADVRAALAKLEGRPTP